MNECDFCDRTDDVIIWTDNDGQTRVACQEHLQQFFGDQL